MPKNKTLTIIPFFILAAALIQNTGCARWKVEEIFPKESIIMPFGKQKHQLSVIRNKSGIFNTPTEIAMDDDAYYVVNSHGSKVLVVNRNNGQVTDILTNTADLSQDSQKDQDTSQELTEIVPEIGITLDPANPGANNEQQSEKKQPNRLISKKAKNLKTHNLPILYPGKIAVANNGNIFLENKTPMASTRSRLFNESPYARKSEEPYSLEAAPASILVIDKDKKLINQLYMDAAKKTPFKQIIGIFAHDSQQLAIISRNDPQKWLIQIFSQTDFKLIDQLEINPEFLAKISKLNNAQEFFLFIENIIARKDNETFMISAAYYKKSRFKFRRIYNIPVAHPENMSLFAEFQEPQSELYSALNNDTTYFWSSSSYNQIRLRIYDNNGDLINNKSMQLFGVDEAWRSFIPTIKGQIISLYFSRLGMEIILWS